MIMNALNIACPVCGAPEGVMCLPMSVDRPHLARQEEADDLARDIERATTPAVVIPIRRRWRDWGQM